MSKRHKDIAMNDVSQKELYRIFNNVVSESSFLKYEEIDNEISLFRQRVHEKWSKNPQIDIFDELPATAEEIRNVSTFCDMLKSYYKEIDKESYTDGCLEENTYRYMYRILEKCDKYVSEENREKYNKMKRDVQRYIPEFRTKIIIEDYIKEAEQIYKLRQKAKKSDRANKSQIKTYYERLAVYFFNEIKKMDTKRKEITPCPEMLVLCEKILQIVDCLPQNKFGRMKKFEMKVNINKSREYIANSLGGAYIQVAEAAIIEQQKYEKAIRTTKQYIENPKKYRPLTMEERNKRSKDEWDYK